MIIGLTVIFALCVHHRHVNHTFQQCQQWCTACARAAVYVSVIHLTSGVGVEGLN